MVWTGCNKFGRLLLYCSQNPSTENAASADACGLAKSLEGITLGFIKKTNCKSTNDFSKNTTSIIAIGPWPKDKLKQLKGRIDSRPVGLEDGDIVPTQFHLTR